MVDGIDAAPVVRPPVVASLLGYAGLLPPIIAVAVRLIDPAKGGMMLALALFYAALILSFLGGMWWGAVSARVWPNGHRISSEKA